MPKLRTGGRRAYQVVTPSQSTTQNTQQQGANVQSNAPQAPAVANNAPIPTIFNVQAGKFVKWDDTDAGAWRDAVDSRYTPSVRDAIKQYISKAQIAGGYSIGQWFNYWNENGQNDNVLKSLGKREIATIKYMDKYINQGMHNLGQNVEMIRADHDGIFQAFGINDYEQYTGAQLKKMLVGKTFQNKANISASYDESKNPFITGSNAGGREVLWHINAGANSQIVFGSKAQAEVLFDTNQNWKITDVKYDKTKKASPRNSYGTKKVVHVYVEV